MSETLSFDALAQRIATVSRLEGAFALRSGQVSQTYFDKYRFEGDPVLLRALAKEMAQRLPTDTEILAGLELGGVPLATAVSLETGLPAAFVRKEAKTYGTCRALEGQDVAGRKITFIEDVITPGGAVSDAYQLAVQDDAQVIATVCAIWRGEGTPHIVGVPAMPVLPVFTRAELMLDV